MVPFFLSPSSSSFSSVKTSFPEDFWDPEGFPRHHYLPPDYDRERLWWTIRTVVIVVLCCVLIPAWTASASKTSSGSAEKSQEKSLMSSSSNNKDKQPTTSKKKAKTRNSSSNINNGHDISKLKGKNLKADSHQDMILEIHPMANILAIVGALFSFLLLLAWTPDNSFTLNVVFQAPLFTTEECQQLLHIADRVATRNVEQARTQEQANFSSKSLLHEPAGWNKDRHHDYPTTDLNLVTDPFSSEEQNWLATLLHRRLTPLIARLWGIPPLSIRANDIFVVRYDAPPSEEEEDAFSSSINKNVLNQPFLANHTDAASISFNVLLDESFEGGGTRFWDRWRQEPFGHVTPELGQVLLHSAHIHHEGMPVTKGRRTILVGFLEVDRVIPYFEMEDSTRQQHELRQPSSAQSTGISWFATWGSAAWLVTQLEYLSLTTQLKRHMGQPTNAFLDSFRGLFPMARQYLLDLTDRFYPPTIRNVIDTGRRQAYLEALDEQYDLQQAQNNNPSKANWFRGQQLAVDVLTGAILTEKKTRRDQRHRFQEL